jgi:hypothetical protein
MSRGESSHQAIIKHVRGDGENKYEYVPVVGARQLRLHPPLTAEHHQDVRVRNTKKGKEGNAPRQGCQSGTTAHRRKRI